MSTKKSRTIEAWHFLPSDRKLRYGDNRIVEVGKTLSAKGDLELCENGMHASVDLMNALEYAPGPILCKVELFGRILDGEDKLCARHRKVVWMLDVEKLLHEFACRCASRALKKAGVTDERCWNAIRVKRKWLVGKANDSELSAAWDAARAAARAAAWDAARAAAWDAARAAALDAARAAARAAAWDAARAAEKKWQKKLLTRMVKIAAKEAGIQI